MTDEPKELSWWWSTDQERYRGPCSTRADAIMEAWADGETGVIHLCQADQGLPRTNVLTDDRLAEMFDDANDESGDPDGDPPSEALPAKEWQTLADRCNAIIKSEFQKRGVRAWAFTDQSGDHTVDLSVGIALAKGRDAMREAIETAADWFREYAAQHDAKGTPEGAAKAKVNRERAAKLRSALDE